MTQFDDRNDWKYEVDNGDTVLGFKAWLAHKQEAEMWTEHDSHSQNCAMRVVSSAECTCGKIDSLSKQEENGMIKAIESKQAGMSINVTLPNEVYDWLKAYAEKQGISISKIVRTLVLAYRQDIENGEDQ